ncbi:hypothetical protein BJ912DRAFT_1000681, partial [Pholiota molesta]
MLVPPQGGIEITQYDPRAPRGWPHHQPRRWKRRGPMGLDTLSDWVAGSFWLSFPELRADTNASYWPPTSSDGSSSSSPAHMWSQPIPLLENMRYDTAPSSSPSPPVPSVLLSSSRSCPVHRARAPMGTVSEATVLWLVRNKPPALVSGLLSEALSLKDPETQLSVLVLRDVLGRHRVTAAEGNEFEATVYDESMDERQRGRKVHKAVAGQSRNQEMFRRGWRRGWRCGIYEADGK